MSCFCKDIFHKITLWFSESLSIPEGMVLWTTANSNTNKRQWDYDTQATHYKWKGCQNRQWLQMHAQICYVSDVQSHCEANVPSCWNWLHVVTVWGCEHDGWWDKLFIKTHSKVLISKPYQILREFREQHKMSRLICSPIIILKLCHVKYLLQIWSNSMESPENMSLNHVLHIAEANVKIQIQFLRNEWPAWAEVKH